MKAILILFSRICSTRILTMIKRDQNHIQHAKEFDNNWFSCHQTFSWILVKISYHIMGNWCEKPFTILTLCWPFAIFSSKAFHYVLTELRTLVSFVNIFSLISFLFSTHDCFLSHQGTLKGTLSILKNVLINKLFCHQFNIVQQYGIRIIRVLYIKLKWYSTERLTSFWTNPGVEMKETVLPKQYLSWTGQHFNITGNLLD